jgi:hypothetical protein
MDDTTVDTQRHLADAIETPIICCQFRDLPFQVTILACLFYLGRKDR